MADKGYVSTLLNPVPADFRGAIRDAFYHVLDSFRIGRSVAGTRAVNGQLYFVSGTTASVADTEFSLRHGLPRPPYTVVAQVLPLDTAGGQIVPIKCTKPSDRTFIYLSSSVTDAAFTVLVEA